MKKTLSKLLILTLLIPFSGWTQSSKQISDATKRAATEALTLYCAPTGIKIPESINGIFKIVTMSDCLQEYPRDATSDQKLLIEQEICKCAQRNPMTLIDAPKASLGFDLESSKAFQNYYQAEKETSFEILKARTATALDASILFENPKEIISDLLAPSKYLESEMKTYLRKTRKKAMASVEQEAPSKEVLKDARADVILKTVQEKFYSSDKKFEAEPQNINSLKDFFNMGKISERQCITYREFHAYNQLPRDAFFMTDVAKSEFDGGQWKYSDLKKQYQEMMSKPVSERKTIAIHDLKAKITFLDRNPMIRHLLESNYSKKKEIFETLQSFSEQKCNEGLTFTGKADEHVQQYREKMKDLLGNSEAQAIIKKSIAREIEQTLKDHSSDNPPTKKFETRSDLIVHLEELYQTSPASCGSSSGQGCAEAYRYYCKELARTPNLLNEAIGDDLKSSLRGDFIPDMDKNAALKEMNEKFCDQPRKKKGAAPEEPGYSFNQYRAKFCPGRDMMECRTEFLRDYGTGFDDPDSINIGNFLGTVAVKAIENKAIDEITSGKGSTFASKKGFDWDGYRKDHGISGGSYAGAMGAEGKVASAGGTGGTLASPLMSNNGQVTPQGYYSNVVAPVVASKENHAKSSERRIEDLSPQEQYDLLNQWKRELEASRGQLGHSQVESTAAANESSLKARIEALEKLLIQQKELSDRQYALLNDSLKSKEKEIEAKVAKAEKVAKKRDEASPEYVETSPYPGGEHYGFNRAPASVKTTAGVQGGTTAGEVGRVGTGSVQAQAMKESSSKEALAREEAKLVNLRQEGNGAIVLENSKGNGANAISVSIPDDVYKQARGNLVGINLKQIERSIPKEQIDLLEKNGVITLILQNGKNPPLEVKVQRVNGALVQVENSPAQVRKFSLRTLQNTFRE